MTAARRSGMLTTHVLDTAHGCPAAGMRIDLSAVDHDGRAHRLKTVTTNGDGRTPEPLLAAHQMTVGSYEIAFHVAGYFQRVGASVADPPFLDVVPVRFAIADAGDHYHVPLLVSPWSYATYRGS